MNRKKSRWYSNGFTLMMIPSNHKTPFKIRFNKNFLFYFLGLLIIIFLIALISILRYQKYVSEKETKLEENHFLNQEIWLYRHYQKKANQELKRLQNSGKELYTDIWPNEKHRFLTSSILPNENPSLPKPKNDTVFLHKSIDFLIEIERSYRRIPLGWPTRTGRVSSLFGYRISPFGFSTDFHSGTDFAAITGTPIYATTNGKVLFAGSRNDGYGYQVRIQHAYGFMTLYAHCSRVLVTANQEVKKGDLIALIGMTGSATGPHVHYEIRLKQKSSSYAPDIFLDPLPFAQQNL